MYSRILFATDGSANAKRAGEHAIALAKKFEGSVTALYVIDPSWYRWTSEVAPSIKSKLKREGRKILKEFQSEAKKQNVKACAKIRTGTPYEEIIKEAVTGKCDAIVLGSRGLTEAARAALGSVAERVVAYAPCAVVVVR